MIRYTAEQKEEALKRVDEIGVHKTHNEMGIAIQTLYKWRTEKDPEKKTFKKYATRKTSAAKPSVDKDVKALLSNKDLLAKMKRLEAENEALTSQNLKLKTALLSLIEK